MSSFPLAATRLGSQVIRMTEVKGDFGRARSTDSRAFPCLVVSEVSVRHESIAEKNRANRFSPRRGFVDCFGHGSDLRSASRRFDAAERRERFRNRSNRLDFDAIDRRRRRSNGTPQARNPRLVVASQTRSKSCRLPTRHDSIEFRPKHSSNTPSFRFQTREPSTERSRSIDGCRPPDNQLFLWKR